MIKLSDFNLLDDQGDNNELSKILESFNDTNANYPNATIVQLFEKIVDEHKEKCALIFEEETITYGQLDQEANKRANFLIANGVEVGDIVGLLYDKSLQMIYTILGVIKAGGVYLPMDPDYPFDRLKFISDDSKLKIILGQKSAIKLLNKLQWECSDLKTVACLESEDFNSEDESLNDLMKKELWDYIGDKSHDDISGGGWFSSYTGEDLSRSEMDEYGENVFEKLKPYLTPETKVLEIGCSSGISMFRIAPKVKSYYGIDLSSSIIEKTLKVVEESGLKNITLENLPAHEVNKIKDKDFDIVIINSVIQLFNGHNYLRDVINKSVDLMSQKGHFFLGDLQDQDKKYDLINSIKSFQKNNADKNYKSKIDWSNELFIAKSFLEDVCIEVEGLKSVTCSDKIHTIKNELTDYRFDAIFEVDKLIQSVDKSKNKIQLDSKSYREVSTDRPNTTISPDDVLYVIYTSGSTGKPKGCKITHKNVVRLIHNDKHDFSFSSEDVWIMAHAYSFDFSVWELYGALLYGGKLILPTQNDVKDITKLHELVSKHKVTVLNQTPLAFNFFIDQEIQSAEHNLDTHLRYVIFGGDKLDPQKFIPWIAYYGLDKISLINMYGITETTVHVSYYKITQKDIENKGVSPIGKPLPETKIYVLNENMKPQPIGIAGEMYVGGTGVCKGYLNRDELTKDRFINSPFNEGEILYKTGDQAKWTDDGNLEYLGRIDFQVKIRGYRIELGEVESIVSAHPDIKEAIVVAHNKNGQNELVSYIVTDKENIETKALREFLKVDLPDFMIPSLFVRIDEVPLTKNGKLNKSALPDPYKESIGSSEEYVAPETYTEIAISEIWSELLAFERVSANDNFFAIGGDSLKAIKVIVQINKKINSNIKVGDIFIYQTVKQLAEFIDSTEINAIGESDYDIGIKKIGEIKSYIESFSKEELPKNYEDIYPLASIEKGMIFSSMLRPEEPVYYDQFTYNLEIKSEQVFRKAFELMIEKHSIMRSQYYMNSFIEPVKVVLNKIELPLYFEDISTFDEKKQEQIINDYLKKDSEQRLTFEGEILWHLKAFSLKKNHFYVVWTVHHAILDGWSESAFVAEFANLCSQNDIMEIKALPKLAKNYKDYTAINIGRENSPKALDFWKDHLDGYSRNKLPFNLSGKKISDELGMERIGKYFDPKLGEQVEVVKNQLGVTYKSICLAAYAYLMHVITTEKEVVSGVVSNDRPEIEDGDKILGCFLNTIPFKIDFEKVKTYRQLISYFSDYLSNVKQHELYLVDIANAVGEKSSSGNPIFDCIFNYTDFHILEDINEENESLEYSTQAANKLDISANNLMTNTMFDVEVDKTMGNLSIGIKYVKAYFRKEDIRYVISLYENILNIIVSDVNKELDASDLLSEQDMNWLLYEFNNTNVDYPSTKLMHTLFEDQVKINKEKIALTLHGKDLTYADLNSSSNQIARLLIENGVKSGDNVGVIADRNFYMIKALMGTLKSGGAYVPVDPSYPIDRQEYILDNSNAKVVLVDDNYELLKHDSSKVYLNLKELDLSSFDISDVEIEKSTSDLAYTIYTSGSTGRPKGVMIEHRSAVNLINWVNTTYNVGVEDRLLFITSMCFDLSVYDIFGILGAGGTVVIATQDEVKDPEILQKVMIDEKITFWDSVPTTMNYLVDMIEMTNNLYQQTDLRLVFMSGDWIPVSLPDRILNYFPNAQNISLGGATEGTVWSNFFPIEKVDNLQTSIPYGKPLDNNSFYILDDNKKPVPKGVAGELFIGGLGVAIGYANDDEKTNASFFMDPFSKLPDARMYKTGDLGRMMPEGNMEFLGRKDFQVKIRGFRVELGEIENQLQKNSNIQRAIVIAKEDGNNSKYLVAYVVLENEIENQEIINHLRQDLPDYMIPTVIIRIDKVPITSNGKIDRKNLPEPNQFLEKVAFESPKTGTEANIAEIWKSILGIETLGRNESVFELGAHSLHAGAFVSKLLKQHKKVLNLRDLFSNPTIAMQAQLADSALEKKFEMIKPIEESDFYDVSASQRRLWVIDQIEEGKSIEYNLPSNYKIIGEFNAQAFEKSIQKVMDRHEILRTSFQSINGEPKQIIKTYSFNLEIESITEIDIKEKVNEHSFQAFNLANGPLFRVKVFKISETFNVVSFVMHHIISDGWSMGILMDEVFKFYGGFISNKEIKLEDLQIQYKEFAYWQNQELNSEAAVNHQKYWLDKLNGHIEPIDLPTIKSRPLNLNNKAAQFSAKINHELTDSIKKFCLEQGISVFMFVNGVLKALVYRYTGQTDLVFGSPIAGRAHADLTNQIGFFVNTLVLRDEINGEKSFIELMKEVKETILDAFDHQIYPYDKLVDDLSLERSLNRNPLFDIMVGMQNIDNQNSNDHFELVEQNLELSRISSGESQSKFDLTFNFFESEEILLNLEYRSELYSAEFISQFWMHFVKYTSELISNATAKIGELNFLTEDEKHELIGFGATENISLTSNNTIVTYFDLSVENNAKRIASIHNNSEISFIELQALSFKYANGLALNKIKKGDVVACLVPRSFDSVGLMLGIMRLGAIYLPIDISTPKERVDYCLNDSNAKLLISSVESKFNLKTLDLEELLMESTEVDEIELDELDPAYIIYTSGSTGKPKGTLISHGGVAPMALAQKEYFNLHAESNMLQFASSAFDASIGEIFGALFNGCKFTIIDDNVRKDPMQFEKYIKDKGVTVAMLPPSFINLFESRVFENFEALASGGETAIITDARNLSKCLNFINIYGPTECTVYSTHYAYNEDDNYETLPIGKMLNGYRGFVLDNNLNLTPKGAKGELCISSKGVALEYINLKELTEDRFVKNPFGEGKLYRTGDLVSWDSNQNLKFFGRIDNQIKLRGFRIELGEIENAIRSIDSISNAFVTVFDEVNDKKIIAYYVGLKVEESDIKRKLSTFLSDYMIPDNFVFLEEFPYNNSGKIDKTKLPKPVLKAKSNYTAPENEIEENLVKIWQEILNIEKIGTNDRFFELGGNSLKAIRVINKSQEDFAIQLTVKDLFGKDTIKELSDVVLEKQLEAFGDDELLNLLD